MTKPKRDFYNQWLHLHGNFLLFVSNQRSQTVFTTMINNMITPAGKLYIYAVCESDFTILKLDWIFWHNYTLHKHTDYMLLYDAHTTAFFFWEKGLLYSDRAQINDWWDTAVLCIKCHFSIIAHLRFQWENVFKLPPLIPSSFGQFILIKVVTCDFFFFCNYYSELKVQLLTNSFNPRKPS